MKALIKLSPIEEKKRQDIIAKAEKKETLFYSDLRLEQDSRQMTKLMKMLNRIGEYEIQNNRPPLCAIVVRKKKVKGKRTPGKGFEKLCIENGCLYMKAMKMIIRISVFRNGVIKSSNECY